MPLMGNFLLRLRHKSHDLHEEVGGVDLFVSGKNLRTDQTKTKFYI